jgi:SAM-dependent methyltransferase
VSGYAAIDQTPDPGRYIERLDEMRSTPFWSALKRRSLRLLEPRPGHVMLEVGCGTGEDARELARLVPGGRVVGIDSSAFMIAEACRRGGDFQVADAGQLPFADASFDGCRSERVLHHLERPRQALAEMVRVARPGARIVVLEPDLATLEIRGADPLVTQVHVQARIEHFRSPTAARYLPKWCCQLGLLDVTVDMPVLSFSTWREDTEAFLTAKYLQGRQVEDGWLASLRHAAREGRFYHGVSLLLVAARKAP